MKCSQIFTLCQPNRFYRVINDRKYMHTLISSFMQIHFHKMCTKKKTGFWFNMNVQIIKSIDRDKANSFLVMNNFMNNVNQSEYEKKN